jgi:hypothetical protein
MGKGDFRPRFQVDKKKWEEVVNLIRRVGIKDVHRAMIEGGDSFVMQLVGQTLDRHGNIKYEQYRRQNTDLGEVDGMYLKGISRNIANGQVWERWLLNKDEKEIYELLKQELKESITPLDIPAPSLSKTNKPHALMIMLADHHFGKLAFGYKDQDWSLETARDVWQKAISYHISAHTENIEKIILPLGNDLLHTNNDTNSTKKGTPMEVSSNFHFLYQFVRDVVTSSIVSLAKYAPVEVVMVQGNHDHDAIFRLGDWLEGCFSNTDAVTVNNLPYNRKYCEYGSNLLGFAHGEKVNAKDIHNAIFADVPDKSARAKHRMFFLGHLHKNWKAKMATWSQQRDEHMGTTVEICPSLTVTDMWHSSNLYTGNIRRSKSYLFCPVDGLVGERYFVV